MGRALLFLVSGLAVILGIARIGNADKVSTIPAKTNDYFYEQQARNISAALVDEAVQNLLKDNDWSGTIDYTGGKTGKGELKSYDITNRSQLPDSVTVPYWDQYTVVLYSVAELNGYKAVSEVLMSRDSFSKYSYFTNRQSEIYFATTDVLSGPVHTNGTFYMAGNPTFNGLVTSPNAWIGRSGQTNNPVFNSGSNFSAPRRDFDVSDQIAELRQKAGQNGLTFTGKIRVEFKSNGIVSIAEQKLIPGTPGNGPWNPGTPDRYEWKDPVNYNINSLGLNGVISSSEDIEVKGQVNGRYTLHSSKDVRITGDIEYKDNPLQNFNSEDLLGIVSEKNIIIDKDAHKSKSNKDLNIHASLMAQNSVSVENYDSGSSRGSLNLVGGMIQDERGAVGTIDSRGRVNTGYEKNYQYDERLRYQVPPHFPRESVFSIQQWKDKIIERPETKDNTPRS